MNVKLQNKIHDFIAVVYKNYKTPQVEAIKPNHEYYNLEKDVEYFIICARHSYIYKNNKITMYNYI